MAPVGGEPVPLPALRQLLPPFTASIVAYMPMFLVGSVAVQIQADLGIGPGGIGLAVACFTGAASLTAFGGGKLVDRLRPSTGLRTSTVLTGAMLLGVAAFGRSLAAMLPMLAVAGAAASMTNAGANLALSRTIHPRRLGFALGIKQAATPMATLLGGLAIPLIALTVGWRWAFAAAGLLAFAIVASIRSTPGGAAKRSRVHQRTASTAMVILAVGGGLASISVAILSVFLVDSAFDAGVSNATAGWLVVAGSVLGLGTRVASGIRADQRGGRHLLTVCRMLLVGAAMFALLALPNPAVIIVVAPLAYCSAWGWNGIFHLAVLRANAHSPGAATGVIQTGFAAGGLAGPLLGGFIAQRYSYEPVWLLAAACAALGAAAIALGRTRMKADARRSASAPS